MLNRIISVRWKNEGSVTRSLRFCENKTNSEVVVNGKGKKSKQH